MGSNDFDADAVERWFVHRGVPQAIFHYNASEDVLTRMVPFLGVVFLLGALAGFGDQFSGWGQFGVALVAFAILFALAVGVNRLRSRRALQLPDDVGILEILVFLSAAPLIGLLFGNSLTFAFWIFVLNAAMLVIGYAVTSYGAWPMFRWGVREIAVQLRGIITLLAKLLPLMLLFATFLFLNAEMWQVAHDLTPELFAIVILLIIGPAIALVALRSPSEVASMHDFSSWHEIDGICAASDAPIPSRSQPPAVEPILVPLDRGERRNFVLLMITAQVVQILLVAVVIGVFFVVFGIVTVREETIVQWTEFSDSNFEPLARFPLFGTDVVITWELFAVSSFIAAISALQFAVSVVGDELYRQQFYASLESEIREVLAVRARYLEPMVAQALSD